MSRRIATVTSQPHSGILDPDSLLVKFDNWVLYDKNFHCIVNEFIKLNNFYFIACSRVDFAGDFNLFDNGMNPENVIRKFVSRKFLKIGKVKGAEVRLDQGKNKHIFSGLKFGSNLSEVTYYLYNKTKELREEVHKPWIWQSWVDGGLRVPTSPVDRENEVWRLEFSLKSGAKLIVNKETGEFDLFASLEIMKIEYITKCYYILYYKYFLFFWNDGQVRKDRMRMLKLFDMHKPREILVDTTSMKDSSRATKIFVKKLHELNNEMRGRDFYMSAEMDRYKELVIKDHGLESWAMYKGYNVPK